MTTVSEIVKGQELAQLPSDNTIREAAEEAGKPVAIMQDLQGPKIRCLTMEDGGVPLEEGAETVITTDDIVGTSRKDKRVQTEKQDSAKTRSKNFKCLKTFHCVH